MHSLYSLQHILTLPRFSLLAVVRLRLSTSRCLSFRVHRFLFSLAGNSALMAGWLAIATGLHQHCDSLLRISRDSWPYWLAAIMLLSLATTVILGSESHGTHDYILVSGCLRTHSPWLYSKSKSKLLYDCRFTANQFLLAPSPLKIMARVFFLLQLNPCRRSPHETSSLTRGWDCLIWICLAVHQVNVSNIQHVIENSSFCTV
jgi:hypothetical protein